MVERILYNVVGGIIERLGSLAFQEIGLIWGVKDELHKLQETVAGFQAVLLDAEQKQAINEVKLWLESVKDAVYEADDGLDEFDIEAQRRQMMRGNTEVSKKVRLLFSSSNQLALGLKMGHKIKDINKRFCEIASHRTFHLEVNRQDTRFIIRERVTHSFVRKENIIGRDEDKKAIIQLLLDPISTENVSTISIFGFGGLGKTALAQLIFNDEVIQNHFELKIWACVSIVFDLDILAKKILKADKLDMDQLQNDLREKVDGKKYLLVLDDMWNENREKWLSFKYLLMGGGKNSRILITTRSETVAKISDTTKPYTLRGLNEEQSWSLFKEMAFKDGKEPENSTIKAIGKEVARKCQGVPLAIRTVCGMLCTKHHESEWLNFKDKKLSKISQEENDILPTLKLSYDVLPSHLKHCFAYCNLFPLDYEIYVPRVIQLWVAQGLITPSNENECLEDVAYEYFMDLLRRSFFQDEEKDASGIIKSCKMHDLMNELAILVSGSRSAIVDPNQKNFSEKLCHLSFNFHVDLSNWKLPTSLLKANKIRTFLFPRQEFSTAVEESLCNSFCSTIVSNFKSLRILSLNVIRMTTLPSCLRKMKHLRYLDLSHNPIKRLPDWIVELQILETLDLSGCNHLVELPSGIGKMINFRHFNLIGCNKLTRIPRGLGELTGLRTLGRFALSTDNSMLGDNAGLGELARLNELRGVLYIRNLRHKKDVMSESNGGATLKEKQHLCSLGLFWKRGEDVNAVDEKDISMSLEVLQPHPNLNKLSVRFYGGVRFASWLWMCNLTSLRLLSIENCPYLASIPEEISNLTSLQKLQIGYCPNLASLPEGIRRLPYLSTLKIWECLMLWFRCKKETGEDWHKIAHIPDIDIY
ncbi:disease resistance protein RGA4 [Pyrus ussuriensis x Pyrus communis]|uniref:Disease resistance protein RGA4 n=1 Tax=Pyrus ussuriensis x Pyrus communis TaxID=2448454 RepID=A0A5N5EV78_9ROSA|nr:disease resistance protein RGA4 [Pyrus ussuriensis x Pyrus communis]